MARTEKDTAQGAAQGDTQGAVQPAAATAEKPTHVYMVRDPKAYPAPHRAHVHLDEVSNYAKGGFVLEEKSER